MTLREEILAHTAVGEEFSVPELVDRIYPGIGYWERTSNINKISRRLVEMNKRWGTVIRVGKARREDGCTVTMWRREE